MSATERLRELLDERGVRWKRKRGRKHDGTEWHDQFGVYAEAVQEYSWDGFEHPEGKLLVRRGMGYLTTKQAIEATLGAGTCRLHDCDGSFSSVNRPVWRCDCGAFMTQYTDATTYHKPRFCPNCGKRCIG